MYLQKQIDNIWCNQSAGGNHEATVGSDNVIKDNIIPLFGCTHLIFKIWDKK